MKTILCSFLFLLICSSSANAQKRVHEKDMVGSTWQLVFDLEEAADNRLERLALSAISGIMDEIAIQLEFQKDHVLRVKVDAFDDNDDDDYSTWMVNKSGQLMMGETDTFDSEETLFMREGDRLIPFEYEKGELVRKRELYLIRVDK